MFKALLWLSCVIFSWSNMAAAAVDVSGRHVFIVHAGVDTIWGTYLFMVANSAAAPEELNMSLMLPKETQDWQAQEGLEKEDISLGSAGGLALKKSFAPGEHLLAIGFKTAASLGQGELKFTAPTNISKLVVMVRKDTLALDGEGFVLHRDVNFGDSVYDSLSRGPIAAGESVSVQITGIPEGRARLWGAGILSVAVLLLSAAALAWRTRPQLQAEA